MFKIENYAEYKKAKEKYRNKIKISLQKANEFLQQFDKFNIILNRISKFDNFNDENILELTEIKTNLKTIRTDSEQIKSIKSVLKTIGIFIIDTTSLKNDLLEIIKKVYPKARSCLSKIYKKQLDKIYNDAKTTEDSLKINKNDLKSYDINLRAIEKLRPNNMKMSNQVELAEGIFHEFFENNSQKADLSTILIKTKDTVRYFFSSYPKNIEN